ncbi:PREDICTED: integrator complex subunit 9 [Trachymyrmex septentrionalis]|uniref:integrator complex subunit 9 n=1 Tax=Trachymyrmex septentrionalis TaxID=34720 RepID=UPI00084F4C82|nr:PREDICTED: integrator complex subunit 9 [Trachymyrmex septentrionalis]
MRLYCLSSEPTKPCLVLTFKGTTLMLDCGLNMQSILHFMPLPMVPSNKFNSLPTWLPRNDNQQDWQIEGELKECCGRVFVDSVPEFTPPLEKIIDFSEIDAILISNYTCMLALPFITEGTGFKGIIYATEPTLQIGRFFMEELVEFIERTPKATMAKHWKDMLHTLPSPLAEVVKPKSWKHIYSMSAVNSALSNIQMVGYDQKLDIYGALIVTPISSGFCLGSSNWLISSDHEKVAFVSGSSTLTTHPKPMDQVTLKHANLLILTGLTQTPTANPDTMLGELCMTVAVTLRAGGCVLIPCYPSGVVYDLFECLSTHLDKSGFTQVPLFFISPVAETSLAYSNILAEWLSTNKQNKVYLPEEPFPHAFLVKNARLKHYTSTYAEGFSSDYRQPCVVFCGHPSLRFGDAVHFVQLWGGNPLHTVIFTEPDFPYLEALAPFQPLSMKAVHCPIDTSLNFTQANKLIRDLKPEHLVIPEVYTQPPGMAPHRTDLVIESIGEKPLITFKRGEVIKLPLKRKKGRVFIEPELASNIVPSEVRPGLSLASVTGELDVKDNVYTIKNVEDKLTGKRKMSLGSPAPIMEEVLKERKHEYGNLDPQELLQKLNQEGFHGAKLQHSPTSTSIHLQDEDTLIQIGDNSTHIFCNGDQKIRKRLRSIIMQCLKRF